MEEKRGENYETREATEILEQTVDNVAEPKKSLSGKVGGWIAGLTIFGVLLYASSGQSELRDKYNRETAAIDSLYNPQIRALENERDAKKDSIKNYLKENGLWTFGR